MPPRRSPGLAWLAAESRGTTIVEFALVAPVLCLFLVGSFDIAHTLYMQAALEGIVQKTARDSGIETNTGVDQQQVIDDRVKGQVLELANDAQLHFARRFYKTFSDAAAAKAETWSDTDHDLTCDNGEPYTDSNANGVWDADGAENGQGGAKDRTVYTVTVTYPHLLPVGGFLGQGPNVTLTARTVLQNQPYTTQSAAANSSIVRNCK